jgi:hypothetical protein
MTKTSTSTDDINREILKLNKLMIKKLGEPPKERGVAPPLKFLLDAWIFYKDNEPDIKDFNDKLNMNMAMYIGERKKHVEKSANAIYNISEKKFYDILTDYIDTQNVPHIEQNSQKDIEKRSQIIDFVETQKELENHLNENLDEQHNFKKYVENENKIRSGGKNHCFMCGDTEDIIKLVEVINSETSNKNLCVECMECQKDMGTKFSKIKDGKVKII